ncbi:type II secretion system F family protein [Acidocella sp.]|uniref:type II secretion system F family protein n=1 Tax=Acidocella sp. TaxID=50710 RepID=UPI0026348CDF|nr:type II secretion system F family protein [Acidocella sp.]
MYSNNVSTATIYELLFLILICFGLVAIAGFVVAADLGKAARLDRRIGLITGDTIEDIKEEDNKPQEALALRLVSGFGMFIARSGVLNRKTLAEMQATLENIGLKGGRGLGLFIGSKILLLLVTPIIAFFIATHMHLSHFWTISAVAGGTVFAIMAPETYATNKRSKFLVKVEAGVPDALDMLVICADAGLALEAGIARVSQEMLTLNPQLATELIQTSREMQIGSDLRMAMDSLGQRTGLEVLKRLATTLAQSLQYGTPLTTALRTLSSELRQEALIKFEERAGRLPTMMTIPMIVFILPCVFLVVAGPAIINVMATLKGSK